ncbi:MAG: hypothetical protein LLG40_09880 [Deltaproteobacteria bacterium]|nr:hypothetical protein [Deltaproteobacteria bacterium]
MKKYILSVLVLLFVATQSIAAGPPPFILPPAGAATTLEGHAASYFQVAHAALSSIGGLTESAGGFPYFTADDTWAVLGIGTAYQILHVNSGATAPDWTSTLGSSSTRLTMGYFTNLEITNSPTVNGTALSALYQPLDSTLTGLAGIAITVDGDNVTFPGAIITTATDGSRKLAVLANTVGVDATSDAFELYPDSDDLWKLNQHGTEYTFVLNGLASTNLIIPSSNSDPETTTGTIKHDSTDTNAASDGSIKVFTGNHVNTLVSATAVADDSYTIITKTEYIPIAYAEDGAAAPAAASVWADTRKAKIRVFAADADDDVEIHWMVPDDYVGGIKFRVVGFVDNATAPANTETVILNLAGCSVGNSDDGGCTLGTGVDSTFTADATYAQHDRWSSAWSNEITVTNIVAGESAMLKLFRDVDDTYGQGIGVAGIEIKYKARVLMADRY